jgi:hypothetical protein
LPQHQSSLTSLVFNYLSKQLLQVSNQRGLLPFTGNEQQRKKIGIGFSLQDYLTLVDETGPIMRDDKRGAINSKAVNILARLHISDESWLKLTTDFEGIFTGAVGTAEHLCEFSEHVGLQRTHGLTNAQACLNSA